MKRKVVSLLLAGCMIAKAGAMAMADELPEIVVTESVSDDTEASTTSEIESVSETTESVTEEVNDEVNDEVNNEVNDEVSEDNAVNENSESDAEDVESETKTEDSKESEEKSKMPTEGETRFEIIKNEDGTSKKVVYEYVVDEESGELIEIVKEEIEGEFDEDGNLIEEIEDEADENIGKIIGFESLDAVSFDHVPTMEELKDSLPTSAVAIIKGEEEDTTQKVKISFDETALESIIEEDAENKADITKEFDITATVDTSIEFAEDVKAPSIHIETVDQGTKYTYQELTNENLGITVAGLMPEGATLELKMINEDNAHIREMVEHNQEMSYDMDSFDMMFAESQFNIAVVDADGNEYTSKEGFLITKTVSEDTINKISDNHFVVYAGDNMIEHAFDRDGKTITFKVDTLGDEFVIMGTETCRFYTVRFEVLSVSDDSFEFSTESRLKKGDDVIVPEFYSDEYKGILDTIDWSDVDSVCEKDAVYTKYVDSKAYDIEKGESVEDPEAESYGEEITLDVKDDEDIKDEKKESIETVTETANKKDESAVETSEVDPETTTEDENEKKESESSEVAGSKDDVLKEEMLLPEEISDELDDAE